MCHECLRKMNGDRDEGARIENAAGQQLAAREANFRDALEARKHHHRTALANLEQLGSVMPQVLPRGTDRILSAFIQTI